MFETFAWDLPMTERSDLQLAGHMEGPWLRPIDLARGHGLSNQAVRNYEAEGILPAAERSDHGYRRYLGRCARSSRSSLPTATRPRPRSCAVHGGALDDALALVDESHAQLLRDRRTLRPWTRPCVT
jgi:hypothetical protein